MRKRIYFGNWKMKLGYQESIDLAKRYLEIGVNEVANQNKLVFVAVSYLAAKEVIELFANSGIHVAAQDCSVMSNLGAYTGEVSALQLAEIGVKGILIGHSERRAVVKETDDMFNQKLHNALNSKLYTCLCFGETAAERAAGKTYEVIDQQLSRGLNHAEINPNAAEFLMVAYEPVWAISSTVGAREATADEIRNVMVYIRNWIKRKFGENIGENMPILYGGSANSDNANELISVENVDGFIPGKASLNAEDFKATISA